MVSLKICGQICGQICGPDLWPDGTGTLYFVGKFPKDRARVQSFQRPAQSDKAARNGRPIPKSTIPVHEYYES